MRSPLPILSILVALAACSDAGTSAAHWREAQAQPIAAANNNGDTGFTRSRPAVSPVAFPAQPTSKPPAMLPIQAPERGSSNRRPARVPVYPDGAVLLTPRPEWADGTHLTNPEDSGRPAARADEFRLPPSSPIQIIPALHMPIPADGCGVFRLC